MGAIRPDTETTNQTQRMLGIYEPDREYAQRMGIHIPHSCPGGLPSFHPGASGSGVVQLSLVPSKATEHACTM